MPLIPCLMATSLIGKPQRALLLRAPGDGVVVPDSPILNPLGDLTVEAWVRPSGAEAGGPFHFIVSKNYEGAGYALVFIGKGDAYRFQFEAGDVVRAEIPMSALRGEWWHVAGVLRAGHSMSLYLNGVEVAAKPTGSFLRPWSGPLMLGTSPWDTFLGTLGEVRLWSVARTQNEIRGDASRRPSPQAPGLIADWELNRIIKGKVYDATHHTRPGIVRGHPRTVRT